MVSITRYPMGMTRRKLRIKLGIDRAYAKRSFRIKQKFLCIPKSERLNYLIRMANRKDGRMLSYKEMWQRRKWFDAHKVRLFPMSEDCKCYACDGLARIRHHVIPISNGGRNKQNNVVPLCDSCHVKIHPKMIRKSLGETGGGLEKERSDRASQLDLGENLAGLCANEEAHP